MKKRQPILLVLAAVFALWLPAAGEGPEEKPSTPRKGAEDAPDKVKVLRFRHVSVDLEKRRIVLAARVCLRQGPLELLVCKAGTKEYESILATEAQAAHLHAAMLALNLTPGMPAQWTGTGEDARFLPPRGPELSISLVWKDKDGKKHSADAARWLKEAREETKAPEKWVFVGSRILPDNRYWADVNGDIISVANFASAVIDVPFESSEKNAALQFAANEGAIPPLETPVEVVIEPLPGADRSDHARALLEVDRLGRLAVGGRTVSPDELTRWAEKYTTRHAKGFVLIRAAGRTMADDVQKAISALRRGGVRDFDVERLRPEGPILPRSADQVRQELKTWDEKFKDPDDYLVPPAQEARATLAQIDRELRELEAAAGLLKRYRQALKAGLDSHEASAKPPEKP